MRLVSIIAFSISILFIYLSIWIAEGSHFSLLNFWDLSSALVIFAGICATLINFKISEIFTAFLDALNFSILEIEKNRQEMDTLVIKTMSSYVFSLSIVSFIMSLIFSLGNLDNLKTFGIHIAISFIVLIYGVVFKFLVFSPLLTSLNNKKII